MKATGTNTAPMASDVAITAKPISAIASRAACIRGLPSSMWRYEFSRTTIVSSMIMPTEIVRASIDIMFKREAHRRT